MDTLYRVCLMHAARRVGHGHAIVAALPPAWRLTTTDSSSSHAHCLPPPPSCYHHGSPPALLQSNHLPDEAAPLKHPFGATTAVFATPNA
eukprot:352554-Chlamydomonas_euryale.AAC.6